VQLEVELVMLVSLQMFWHWSTQAKPLPQPQLRAKKWLWLGRGTVGHWYDDTRDSQILGTPLAPTVRSRALLLLLITEHFVRMRNPQEQQSEDMRLCDRLVAFWRCFPGSLHVA